MKYDFELNYGQKSKCQRDQPNSYDKDDILYFFFVCQ
jgi:hypothetical protein